MCVCVWFQDEGLGEIQELVGTTPEELTGDDLMEMSVSEDGKESQKTNRRDSLAEAPNYSRLLLTSLTTWTLLWYTH